MGDPFYNHRVPGMGHGSSGYKGGPGMVKHTRKRWIFPPMFILSNIRYVEYYVKKK